MVWKTLYDLVRNSIEQFSERVAFNMLDGDVVTFKEVGDRIKDVQQKLTSVSKWSEVNLEGAKWNVSNKEGFINAVASVMSPLM